MVDSGKKVPQVTVKRLSRYLRALERFQEQGYENISSEELANDLHLKPSQLRKDLAYFGEFGTRGMGYSIPKLTEELRRILGLHRQWAIAIIGVGNLGTALLRYKGLNQKGFRVAALFDDDPEKVGSARSGIRIYPMDRLSEIVKEKNIQIAIITVPAPAARSVADAVIGAGVKAIMNFAPVTIKTTQDVMCLQVDITSELKILSHFLTSSEMKESDLVTLTEEKSTLSSIELENG